MPTGLGERFIRPLPGFVNRITPIRLPLAARQVFQDIPVFLRAPRERNAVESGEVG